MKKLYSRSLIAFLSPQRDRIKALRIFLLALALSCFGYSGNAQVVVTPANDTLVCAQTALNGSLPACTTLGTITISETLNSDFSFLGAGTPNNIILNPPTGWQFCTTPAPVLAFSGGGDITALPTIAAFSASSLQIDIPTTGTVLHDQITITGLRIQPVLTSSSTGNIYAFSTLGVAGIVTGSGGTSFGRLGLIPIPISGPVRLCEGSCATFTSSPGVTWTTSNPAVATVTAGGVVCGVSFATSVTITATLGGCFQTFALRVDSIPDPIVITTGDSMLCAWYDSINVRDNTPGGTFTSTLVTADNSLGPAMAKIKAGPPGIGIIRYTAPTGCYIERQVTVNPNPYPIMPLDMTAPYFEICRGSTRRYTCVPGGGTWATTTPAIATVATVAGGMGDVTGVTVGLTKLIYTAPGTGCMTDTTIKVNDLPTPISGDVEICVGEVTTLASGPCGGSWSSVNTTVTDRVALRGCGDSADFSGFSAGTSIILYTLPTGCAQITTITVNPLPGTIGGPTQVCVGGVITLLNSASGGVWRSLNTSIATIDSVTGDLTGVLPGIDTVTYTLPTGCSAFTIITVNPLPSPIIGPDSLCVGDVDTFFSAPSGGTWSSSIIATGVIDPAGFFSALNPGITDICYTLGTGCQVCKTVTVNPVPAPIVGPDQVCVLDKIYLSNSTTGGTWISMDPTYAIIDTVGGVGVIGVAPNPFGVEIRYYVGACYTSKFITVNPVPVIGGPTAVCQGSTITLTVTPAVPGTWTSEDTSILVVDSLTGVVTGVSAGSKNITFTSSGGCEDVHLVDVYSNEPIYGDSTVCKYDSIILNNNVPGGLWTTTPGTFIALVNLGGTPSQAKVIGLAAGVETITYTAPGPIGCFSTYTVTVDPIEPISYNTTQLCKNSCDSVWNVVPGGIWLTSNPAIATITSTGVVCGVDTGVVIISYQTPTCLSTLEITINPIPGFIEGDTAVCQGQTTVFSSADTGGRWTSSNTSIATVDSISGLITGIGPGVAVITYAFPGTGCYVVDSIIVHPLTPIGTMDSVLCVGDSTLLWNATLGGTWSRYDPLVTAIGTIPFTVIGISPGVDSIYYILPTGCSAVLPITVNPNPSPIVGKDSVCQFDTIMLTDVDTGGTWTSRFGFAPVDLITGVVTGSIVGIDSIYYTFATGCRTVKHVVVNRTPTAIIGDSTVCLGRTSTLPLSSTPTTGYWTVLDTSAIVIVPVTAGSIVIHGKALDTTSVFYTLPVGSCRVRVLVTVDPIPTIVVTPNPTPVKCKYDTVVLTATGADSAGFSTGTYTWSPAYGLNTTVGPVVRAVPTVTTVYTVVGRGATGCDSFTTVTVVVDDSLNNLKIVGDSNICAGECTIMMASGRAHTYFNWHPSVGLSCTICDTVTACPTSTTTYFAVAIDDIGCKDSVSFRVNVHPVPVVRVDPNPAIVCRGTPTQLKAFSPNTDDTTNIYTWKPNLFISCDTCYNPVINDTANIVYRVTGTTIWGCHDSFDVKVSVLDTNLNTISNDTNICDRTSALLFATSKSLVSNLDIPTFTWMPTTGLSDPDSSVTYATPAATTTYTLAIRENACFNDTLTVTVFVEPYPQIDIEASATTNIVAGTPVRLIARVMNNAPVLHYAWAPANTLSCDSCFNPEAIPIGPGPTTYTVTVTSIYGCTNTDTITLNLYCDQSQLYVANTFTPNGDGVNDIFFIQGKGIRMITLFQIYNRWGEMVFEQRNIQANDVTRGWDGTYKGLVLPPDVFTYVIKAECELGTTSTFTYKGDVSIVK